MSEIIDVILYTLLCVVLLKVSTLLFSLLFLWSTDTRERVSPVNNPYGNNSKLKM